MALPFDVEPSAYAHRSPFNSATSQLPTSVGGANFSANAFNASVTKFPPSAFAFAIAALVRASQISVPRP